MEKGGIPDYGTPFLGDYAYLSVMASDSGCVIINKALGCQTLHKFVHWVSGCELPETSTGSSKPATIN